MRRRSETPLLDELLGEFVEAMRIDSLLAYPENITDEKFIRDRFGGSHDDKEYMAQLKEYIASLQKELEILIDCDMKIHLNSFNKYGEIKNTHSFRQHGLVSALLNLTKSTN